MKFIETAIKGVVIIEPRIFRDDRGYFYESYNRSTFHTAGIKADFVQDNQSASSYGVIRGLHAQAGEYAQAKLVRAIHGRVLDVAVDARENSPTYGQHISVELSDENMRQLFIPRGFLHGFSVLSPKAVFAYKCDNLYKKEAEYGARFNDPDLNIDWGIPHAQAQISEKDNAQQRFKNVIGYRG